MLTVLTWKWGQLYTADHVNKLRSMLARHLRLPHQLHLITDDGGAAEYPGVVVHPMRHDHAEMVSGGRSCFRRLWMLSREAGEVIGPRILHLDLDVVLVGDVTPLFDRPEPLVIYDQHTHSRTVYNPSMMLMDAGALHTAWEEFHAAPAATLARALAAGWTQSDMAIINMYAHAMVPKPPVWDERDGARAWFRMRRHAGALPADARIVLFYGPDDPSKPDVQKMAPWVAEHWR